MNGTCVAPHEMREGDLLAFLDDEATPGVVAHLARCATCAAQAADLAGLQALLHGARWRAACPAPDDLLLYQADLLSRRARRQIKDHLAHCRACQADVARLALPEQAPAAQPSLLDRMRQTGARIMTAWQPLAPQPIMALRGAAQPLRQFRADPYFVTLKTSPAQPPDGGMRLEGQLGLVNGQLLPAAERQVSLLLGAEVIAAAALDELGFFAFDALPADVYRLGFMLEDGALLIEAVEVA